ncbi:hypothetical protein ROZALSC1DRAFT_28109 [Rozella allomycis CSF55]|uniref:DEK C-terminal domain-containing protein n=1 Tax=Rozella allomycis (strain CSF55) TaxID=988480 RepID=A0A075AU79_ROZAC|nr:hypothetical protein O9G_002535 [Rozella allomycis CSF55]RKP20390.1 hypothetical protein ROZALSC1DRAFT_28109 [Rozella allomycis CSF55]|eukprot:EPZ33823.1 hypothetical protein O9G_002535 [Rozella allomycis CSF55]
MLSEIASTEVLDKLKETINKIVSEGDIDSLTTRQIRGKLAETSEFDADLFERVEIKEYIKECIKDAVLEKTNDEKENISENIPMGETENNKDDASKESQEIIDENNEQEDMEEDAEREEENLDDINDEENDENEINIEKDGKSKSPKKKEATSKKNSMTASDKKIERLKNYIRACVRKNDLAGLKKGEQIAKLQKTLEDLGVKGTPTLKKCEAIKRKRDLASELKELEDSGFKDKEDVNVTSDDEKEIQRPTRKKIDLSHLGDPDDD